VWLLVNRADKQSARQAVDCSVATGGPARSPAWRLPAWRSPVSAGSVALAELTAVRNGQDRSLYRMPSPQRTRRRSRWL